MNVADGPRRLELLEGQAAITCAEQGQGLTVAAGAGEILLDAASVGLRRSGDEVTVTCLRAAWISAIPRANWRWKPASRRATAP